jgi:hypothetical protein
MDEKKRVTNTSVAERHNEWLFGRYPSAIEDQEARGQAELVNSCQLPVNVTGRENLEAAGVKFGEPDPKDPLFCDCELPEGWKKLATEHAMWSKLVDADGKTRASIFYKAAFYDRSAFMRATGE